MKKFRELISRPSVTIALFALAIVLLGGSTVGGARAALTVESQEYNSQVQTYNIDVALLENGSEVKAGGNLLVDLLQRNGDKTLKIGKEYTENLAVQNTGKIDEYVRVTVYKYWMKKDPQDNNKYKKVADMESSWIELGFVTDGGWTVDEASSTEERTVLYYADPLKSNGGTSTPFLKSVTINEKAARTVTQPEDEDGYIVTTYVYEGSEFCLEVHIDGVQTHNADKAKLSAWGVNK